MAERLVTARRTVNMYDWHDGRQWDIVTGRGRAVPKMAKSPWTFACMQIRGYELANIPWYIKRNDKILDTHPLIDMLKDFGPENDWHRGVMHTEMDQLQWGAGLWLRDVDVLKRLDPATIKVEKTNKGIKGFTQRIETPDGVMKTNHFKRDEVVYFREYHPEDQLGFGLPVSEVVKRNQTAEIEAILMIEANFKNDAVPGLLLTTDQDVSEKSAREVLTWWNKRFRGSRNKGKTGIAGKGLKPFPVGANMKDSGVIEMFDVIHNDICVGMRVPKELVGSGDTATYLNMNELRKFFVENTIMPRSREYENTINQDLVPYVDDSVRFEFAFEEMKLFQEESTAKQERLSLAMADGVIGEDFYREEMGYPTTAKPSPEEDAEKKAEKQAENKFEKKAVKALLRGDSANVDFQTDNISIDRQYVLHGRLMNATTEEAVRACFD